MNEMVRVKDLLPGQRVVTGCGTYYDDPGSMTITQIDTDGYFTRIVATDDQTGTEISGTMVSTATYELKVG